MSVQGKIPSRLHHTAYVTKDLEATRLFYEDLLGFPLIATWCESDEIFGAVRTYCHCFFGIGDGSALAFFQFEKPEDQELFGPKIPSTPFHHIALKCDAETQNQVKGGSRPRAIESPTALSLSMATARRSTSPIRTGWLSS